MSRAARIVGAARRPTTGSIAGSTVGLVAGFIVGFIAGSTVGSGRRRHRAGSSDLGDGVTTSPSPVNLSPILRTGAHGDPSPVHLPVDPSSAAVEPAVGRLHQDPPLRIDTLDAATRERLGPVLYEIFCESYGALPRSTICDEIIFRPGGRLFVYRDDTGQIVGFVSIAIPSLRIDGRTYGIVQCGIYFRRRCRRAGARAVARGVRCCLEYKLRYPWRTVRAVCETLSPASYRAVARWLPRVYPSRYGPVPDAERQILSTVIDARGLLPTGRPFVVHYPDPAAHRVPEHPTSAASLRDDPDVRFYLQHNPRFAEGHILCAVVALDWRDYLIGFGRYFARILSRSSR